MNHQTILLTCAGKSTRFPNHRSKWSLTHPNGDTMAAMALKGLDFDPTTRIVVALNADDYAHFNPQAVLNEFLASSFVVDVVNVGETQHQVETVIRALEVARVPDESALTVRDCDNYFEWSVTKGNRVAVVDLNKTDAPLIARNKSYIITDEGSDNIIELAEKHVLSSFFCCGAYSFRMAEQVPRHARSATYLSTVVQNAIDSGEQFDASEATAYEDWGTEQDWLNYTRQWRTLFVDIDGVLVKASHRSFNPTWGESEIIKENIAALNALYATGKVEIILTTSRHEDYRDETIEQLSSLNYDRLIMGLRNCARVLVNDSVSKRRQLTALAVNIERESPALGELLAMK